MKLIIAGSRDIEDIKLLYEGFNEHTYLDLENQITEVVSGGARGVDYLGEQWAQGIGHIKVKRFPADWDQYGKKAGILRNQQMAEYADALLAIWNGHSKGTLNMIQEMQKRSKPIFIFVVPNDRLL